MRRSALATITLAVVTGGLVAGLTAVPDPATGARAGAASSGSGSARASGSPVQFAYGAHPRQVLDVYTPDGVRGRRPTVVLVYGGSWVKGDKTAMAEPARAFVRRGYTAVSVNYRYAPDARWPGQREDLQKALRWLTDRSRARALHVDPERVVVLGSSAGAEIAASALTHGRGTRYARALVALSGPIDLELTARDNSGLGAILTGLLGCGPRVCEDRYERASAIDKVGKRDPAALVVASEHEWVDPRSSVRFHQAARRAGMRSRLVMLPGHAHGMDAWDEVWPTVRRWVKKRMAADR